jgi:hypothetical protein
MTFVMGGKPNGVVDIIQLNAREFIPPSADKVIFVVRPELDVIRSLIYQKQGFKTEKDIYILYVPRRTIECDEELEKAGVRYCPLNIISSCMTRKKLGRYLWI